ncbi:hypothetical protein MED01_004258 [Micromonospora sp. MED01]|uniref:hypothetical protein n=1 Tax=Micromonospora alfalfae TaxID=2911212 RepID=UPI001EE88F7F|nr:hypothetical protein [Micromonospora alfalfae]MCG5460832.1 hypothetical protein [Micromonospora alfalfae]
MGDMQRYRDIKAKATEDDPTAKLRAQLVIAFDQALAESIRLERQGKPGKVRALGFTETADLLDEVTPATEPVCLQCRPAPVTFRCRELGHTIRPN